MLTNADMTLYRRNYHPASQKDEWTRQYVRGIWWFCETKSEITTNGLQSADIVTVRIPDLSVEVEKGDYVVEGLCDREMETVKDLKGIPYFCVTAANQNRFGGNPHIKVVAQ